MSFDSIIVGGGHNGLAAAIALQKRGKKVLLLEARKVLGGLCAAREFHPGFTVPGVFHDTFEVRAPLLDALGLLPPPSSATSLSLLASQPSPRGGGTPPRHHGLSTDVPPPCGEGRPSLSSEARLAGRGWG